MIATHFLAYDVCVKSTYSYKGPASYFLHTGSLSGLNPVGFPLAEPVTPRCCHVAAWRQTVAPLLSVCHSLCVCVCMCACDGVNMKTSFIATVSTVALHETNITPTNPNNPAPKIHPRRPALHKGSAHCL